MSHWQRIITPRMSRIASRHLVSILRPPKPVSAPLLRQYPRLPQVLQPIAHRFVHTIPRPPTPAGDAETQSRKLIEPHYQLTFTCVPCGRRSAHKVSKQGYHKGSVLITCPSCRNRHVISDNLNIFGDRKITVEDLLREKGQLVKRGTLGEHGDIEFWEDTTSADSSETGEAGAATAEEGEYELRTPHDIHIPPSSATRPTHSASVFPNSAGARPSAGQDTRQSSTTPSDRRQYNTKVFSPPAGLEGKTPRLLGTRKWKFAVNPRPSIDFSRILEHFKVPKGASPPFDSNAVALLRAVMQQGGDDTNSRIKPIKVDSDNDHSHRPAPPTIPTSQSMSKLKIRWVLGNEESAGPRPPQAVKPRELRQGDHIVGRFVPGATRFNSVRFVSIESQGNIRTSPREDKPSTHSSLSERRPPGGEPADQSTKRRGFDRPIYLPVVPDSDSGPKPT
ncbi:DNL zinc finger-domain-containing protein [Xylaria intraflava]|nr:DNL zinc finger-domain-containing protein [Xylaria intraflava]